MTMTARAFALSLATAASLAAFSHPIRAESHSPATADGAAATLGDLVIEGAWTRQTPPRAKAGGAYARITNTGTADDRLVGGSAPFAGRVEIHEMAIDDGIMTMRKLKDGLTIPAGETVELKPGSYHVMLLDMTDPPRQGGTASLTLVFDKAGEVALELPVAAVGAPRLGAEKADGMAHGTMKHGMEHGSGHDATN